MLPLSAVISFMLGLAILRPLVPGAMQTLANATSATELSFMLFGMACATCALFYTAQVVVLAVLALFVRGKDAVGFAMPKECKSLRTWVSDYWRYTSTQGKQEGLRFLGVEVALRGQLI